MKIEDIGWIGTLFIRELQNGETQYSIHVAFYDEYNEKSDSTLCRKRTLKKDELGYYITYKGNRYYSNKLDNRIKEAEENRKKQLEKQSEEELEKE